MLEASLDAKQGLPCGNQSWRDRLRQRQLCARVFGPALVCRLPLRAECCAFEIVSLAADILDGFTVRQLKWGVPCSGDLLTCLPEGPSAIPKVATKLGAGRLAPLCSIKDKEAFEGLLYWVNMLHIGVRVLEWAFVYERSCEGGGKMSFH